MWAASAASPTAAKRRASGPARLLSLIATLAILAPAAAADTPVSSPQGSLGECASGKTCAATWNPESAGDDRIAVVADAGHLEARAPAPSGTSLDVSLSGASVGHPAHRHLNATWSRLNSSRPAALEDEVWFESRPKRDEDRGWGVFLSVDVPRFRRVAIVSYCWSICQLDGNSFAHSNETEVSPAPSGGVLDLSEGTDHALVHKGDEVDRCLALNLRCPARLPAAPVAARLASTLPDVAVSFALRDIAVRVGEPAWPSGDSPSPPATGGNRPSTRPAFTPPGPEQPPGSPPVAGPRPGLLASLGPGPVVHDRVTTVGDAWAELPIGPGPESAALVVIGVFALVVIGLLLALRADPLAHPRRRIVYEHFVERPGTRIGTAAAALGMSHNLTKYHVARLMLAGLLRAEGGGTRKRYFRRGIAGSDVPHEGSRRGWPRVVLCLLASGGESDYPSIRRSTGIPASSLTETVKRLSAWGLVRVKGTRPRRVLILDAGEKAVQADPLVRRAPPERASSGTLAGDD